MGQADHVLAIDQGTTSTRAMLFDRDARQRSVAQRELRQHYPASGWVEHDPEEIWNATLEATRAAIELAAVDPSRIAAIGIANQRETVVLWDRSSGEPVHPAIVWQDRRTAEQCARLREDGAEAMVRARTGLLLDPYFSATKIAWVLDHVPAARARAERGELACGTIDAFLLWRLTGGAVHATDVTNASRTLLFDIHRQCWDSELCRLFDVPIQLLPEVRGNSELYGASSAGLFGRPLPVAGMAGDQQAALVGQACFRAGMAKSTYGTGCFMLVNTGANAVASSQRLLTTPAYRIGKEICYALEGSIFVAGAAIKWLRDGLGVIAEASETERMATLMPDNHGVYMVHAFTGLGAPHWEPTARAAIHGLTLDTTAAHLARAALEAVAYQSLDLIEAMAVDFPGGASAMRIDGGMAANAWLCQFLADVLQMPIERPANLETTALGAAFLAGLATAIWGGIDALEAGWAARDRFEPAMDAGPREQLIKGWQSAVARTLPNAAQ